LGFGIVSAQSQAAAGLLLRQNRAKFPKIPVPHGDSISSNALTAAQLASGKGKTKAETKAESGKRK